MFVYVYVGIPLGWGEQMVRDVILRASMAGSRFSLCLDSSEVIGSVQSLPYGIHWESLGIVYRDTKVLIRLPMSIQIGSR